MYSFEEYIFEIVNCSSQICISENTIVELSCTSSYLNDFYRLFGYSFSTKILHFSQKYVYGKYLCSESKCTVRSRVFFVPFRWSIESSVFQIIRILCLTSWTSNAAQQRKMSSRNGITDFHRSPFERVTSLFLSRKAPVMCTSDTTTLMTKQFT